MQINKIALMISLLISTLLINTVVQAKPFCALRDPVHEVYALLPEAKTFKSIVHLVGKQTRKEILQVLPFTIHSKEIGQHTVYIGLNEEKPVGIVHVRSEAGRWGLLEIAWALDLDGKIKDFRFQRCREKACDEIGSQEFRRQLTGMDLDKLKSLIKEDGTFNTEALDLPAGSSELVESVLRSAMKTIVITDMVWGKDIQALNETASSLVINDQI